MEALFVRKNKTLMCFFADLLRRIFLITRANAYPPHEDTVQNAGFNEFSQSNNNQHVILHMATTEVNPTGGPKRRPFLNTEYADYGLAYLEVRTW